MNEDPEKVIWVFVIGLRAPDGTVEQREFTVQDERLATIIKRIIFDKDATHEEIKEFAQKVDEDPALAREFEGIKPYLKADWSIN